MRNDAPPMGMEETIALRFGFRESRRLAGRRCAYQAQQKKCHITMTFRAMRGRPHVTCVRACGSGGERSLFQFVYRGRHAGLIGVSHWEPRVFDMDSTQSEMYENGTCGARRFF